MVRDPLRVDTDRSVLGDPHPPSPGPSEGPPSPPRRWGRPKGEFPFRLGVVYPDCGLRPARNLGSVPTPHSRMESGPPCLRSPTVSTGPTVSTFPCRSDTLVLGHTRGPGSDTPETSTGGQPGSGLEPGLRWSRPGHLSRLNPGRRRERPTEGKS